MGINNLAGKNVKMMTLKMLLRAEYRIEFDLKINFPFRKYC